MRKTTFIMALTVATASLHAQTPPADLAKGAVDPLDAGGQKSRFLRAAGVDSELSGEEFASDSAKSDGFARSFDKWDAVAKFDKDSNGTLNWFEAQDYREDLRARFLAEYDADKNRKLNGPERDKANEALAAGKLPKAVAVARAAAPAPAAPAPGGRGGPGFGGRGGFGNDPETQRIQQQLLQKYDADGDGRLNREERRASGEEAGQLFRESYTKRFDTDGDGQVGEAEQQAARDQFRTRQFDADGDGKLNEAEQAEADRVAEQFRQRGEEFRQRMVKEYDKDGDGQLSDTEQQAAREGFQRRGEEMRRQFVQRFDADGDGEISPEEGETARKESIKEFDKDGDGELNGEERRAAFEAFQQRGGNNFQ